VTPRALRLLLSLIACALGAAGLIASAGAQDAGIAYSMELTGTIDPATESWVGNALDEAEDEDAELVLIRLDTPGGLDSSMREIVKDIIAAPMPVVVYVSPDGARAASAGLFVTQAADVAAMAPQTNIGSASPISIGGEDVGDVLGRKIENDAVAYVRALAEEHGRDADLAAAMVTDAENVTAAEALDARLIDVIATDEEDLLEQLDGFEVQGPKAQTLETQGLVVERHDMPLQFDLLQLIVNPTVSFLLLTAGILGLVIEIFSPGLVLPGALGAVSFLLGLYGTSQLPLTFAGIALLIVGVALIIAEAHVTGGFLGAVGVVAIVLAGLLLYDTNSDALEVSAPVVIVAGLSIGGLLAFVVSKVVEARKRPVMTGWEELAGAEGVVRQALSPLGQVFVEGALWRAEAADEAGSIPVGARVSVESVDGLTLKVRPLEAAAPTGSPAPRSEPRREADPPA
jgi:membrane-bound serine protease (ClpP class)